MKYFSTLTSNEVRELGREGGLKKRSSNLQFAWQEQYKLKREHFENNRSIKEIAKEYGIEIRSAYRIIKEK